MTSLHPGHAKQQLHSTRGRVVQTQIDRKQALTITSNLLTTKITISTSTVTRCQRFLVLDHPESGVAPIGKEGGGGTMCPRKCGGSEFSLRSPGWLSSTRCSTGVLTALMVNHGTSPRSQASPRVRVGTFGGADCGGYASWSIRSLRKR